MHLEWDRVAFRDSNTVSLAQPRQNWESRIQWQELQGGITIWSPGATVRVTWA